MAYIALIEKTHFAFDTIKICLEMTEIWPKKSNCLACNGISVRLAGG